MSTPFADRLKRWMQPQRWSLRERILLPVGILVLLAVAMANGLAAWRLFNLVNAGQEDLGLAQSETLSHSAGALLQDGQGDSLQPLVDDLVKDKNITYAYVVDTRGKFLARADDEGFPQGLERMNVPQGGSSRQQAKKLALNGLSRLDIATPMENGSLGVAHVGVDLEIANRQVWMTTFFNLLLSVPFLALGLFWLSKRVTAAMEPVQDLAHAAVLVEHSGDLTWHASSTIEGTDEVARLSRAFESMLKRFAEVPRSLAKQAALLNTQVQGLKRDHQVQGAILVSQASALTQTQVTSEEIRQTSRQAALQAKALIEEAAKARDMSRSGGDALGKSLDSLLSVRSRVELLAADVEALESRARRIEGIIDSVKDLADQSNLLALNAAIEAMRAGAQGQGFGLVAREIRALADQSIAATEQVRLVLGDLNDGVRDAAKASREGVHDIQKGLERVQGSAETLADIQVTVSESVGQLQRIAAVVQQQDEGLGQVFIALKDQGERMREAEVQQRRTAEAVSQLEHAASAIDGVVKSFKI